MLFDVLHVLVVITENLCIDISLEKMVQTIQLLQGVEKSEQVTVGPEKIDDILENVRPSSYIGVRRIRERGVT